MCWDLGVDYCWKKFAKLSFVFFFFPILYYISRLWCSRLFVCRINKQPFDPFACVSICLSSQFLYHLGIIFIAFGYRSSLNLIFLWTLRSFFFLNNYKWKILIIFLFYILFLISNLITFVGIPDINEILIYDYICDVLLPKFFNNKMVLRIHESSQKNFNLWLHLWSSRSQNFND